VTQRKALAVAFKADGPEGAFEATFSRFNVVDYDGDVTLPGAFTVGAKARIAQFAHNWNVYTIGKGVLQADAERCWMSGQFNLKTTAGRDHYESVKDAEELQEWSYGYDSPGARPPTPEELKRWPTAKRVLPKLIVHEVSPVMLGAGIGTGTDSIKAAFKAAKQVALSDEQKRDEIQAAIAAANGGEIYNGPYVVATFDQYVIVRDYETSTYLRVNYTIDANNVVTIGESAEVEQTWVPKGRRGRIAGKARAVAARVKAMPGIDPATIAVIAQVDLLADELDELVDTLMDTFDIPDPDEIAEGEPEEPMAAATTFRDHANRAARSEERFVSRAKALIALRQKEGRTFSQSNWDFLASHADTLETQLSSLRKLLEEHAPPPKSAAIRLRLMKARLGEAATRGGYAITP
jgi:hypothetical protein